MPSFECHPTGAAFPEQIGGVEINDRCETNVKGLYVAGEASGGVHGRNRLMGNRVLDYNVFGRRAGKFADEYVKTAVVGKLSLAHLQAYEDEIKKAKIVTEKVGLGMEGLPAPVREPA
jgi:succinate dehydrogenase/fumarate reductase flavoprotein subunit